MARPSAAPCPPARRCPVSDRPDRRTRTSRQRDWAAYDRSLRARGEITTYIHSSVLDAWKAGPQGRRGPRGYADVAIVVSLALAEAFSLPLRQAEGFVSSMLLALGRGDLKAPDHTTLSWRRRRLAVALATPEAAAVFDTARAAAGGPLAIAVDGTGKVICGPGAWRSHKWGAGDETTTRRWWRVTQATDPTTGEVLGVLAEGVDERAEHQGLGELLDEATSRLGGIDEVLGDGAYDNGTCYEELARRGARLVTPPQANATLHLATLGRGRAKRIVDEPRWEGRNARLLSRNATGDDAAWKTDEAYGRRSLSEVTFSRDEAAFGPGLSARGREARTAQSRLRYQLLNTWRAIEISLAGGYTSFAAR